MKEMLNRKKESSILGFSLVEVLVALVVFASVIAAVFGIYKQSQKSGDFNREITEAQQNARGALDAIVADLRAAGYGIDPTTQVPVEVASDYRITILRDVNRNGVINLGERITYFVDPSTSDPLVSTTQNPNDCVIRKVVSSGANPQATPASGTGEVIAYGITQITADVVAQASVVPVPVADGWDTPLFVYRDDIGQDLLASAMANDPDGPEWGRTVSDSLLGEQHLPNVPPAIHSITVDVVAETARPNPQNGQYRRSHFLACQSQKPVARPGDSDGGHRHGHRHRDGNGNRHGHRNGHWHWNRHRDGNGSFPSARGAADSYPHGQRSDAPAWRHQRAGFAGGLPDDSGWPARPGHRAGHEGGHLE
jgi:prepilin-type N-terminal cleavage/methylation domain-containing protein